MCTIIPAQFIPGFSRLFEYSEHINSHGIRNIWTDVWSRNKKENEIILGYKEIRKGAVAKLYLYMTNGLLILTKFLRISSYISKPFLTYDFATAPSWISLTNEENFILFFISVTIACFCKGDCNWKDDFMQI